MQLTFQHDPRGESLTLIRRADGAVFTLSSYTRKWRVPHDLAHAVTERELGIADGIFGVIAAGGVFASMTQIGGKKRHDAKVRSARVLKAAKGIVISEVISAVVHHAVETRRPTPYAEVREGWGVISQDPCPYLDEDIHRATTVLRELGEQWSATSGPLEFHWPGFSPTTPTAPGADRARRPANVTGGVVTGPPTRMFSDSAGRRAVGFCGVCLRFRWSTRMRSMAVLLQFSVSSATRDQHDELDARVGQAMSDASGPPPGLMSHVVYPEGDGFVVADVWRTEAEGSSYVDDVLRPLLAELHLKASETTTRPVWSFARP